ncbi:MAG: hypothetical protein HYW48_09980 [Deltaproteobacteria bacterium]|nr:hypothetical protein [Deltaproteobacteria bacterium]
MMRIFAVVLFFLFACADEFEAPEIELSTSSPIAFATDASKQVFYVLNSDMNHRFSSGSILVLSKEGEKLTRVKTPRIGRHLTVRGNDLFATFDKESGDNEGTKLLLFDISTPTNPSPVKEFPLDSCDPLNIVAPANYAYFAVTCLNGKLFVGELKDPRRDSTVKHVRTYSGFTRRAMHLDKSRGLLFSFVTDIGAPDLFDKKDRDEVSYETNAKVEGSGPNEIPDEIEKSKTRSLALNRDSSHFQFTIYDINKAIQDGFPLLEKEQVPRTEYRWLYFNLKNGDGEWDDKEVADEPTKFKYYRTNFWEAQADEDNADIFYLSHVGYAKDGYSEKANDVIKVTISTTNDPRTTEKTSDFFTFERVYGLSKDERGGDKYLASFQLTKLNDKKVVVVNSFRDLVNFDNPRYIVAVRRLEDGKFMQAASSDLEQSYFGLAVAGDTILTGSFYTHGLRLFKIDLESDTLNLLNSYD